MNIIDLLVGKKVRIMTDVQVPVELVIKSIQSNSRYVETGPSNAANDWYPDGYHQESYSVTFENGYTKRYDSLGSIELV
jgi:hypothetical protein